MPLTSPGPRCEVAGGEPGGIATRKGFMSKTRYGRVATLIGIAFLASTSMAGATGQQAGPIKPPQPLNPPPTEAPPTKEEYEKIAPQIWQGTLKEFAEKDGVTVDAEQRQMEYSALAHEVGDKARVEYADAYAGARIIRENGTIRVGIAVKRGNVNGDRIRALFVEALGEEPVMFEASYNEAESAFLGNGRLQEEAKLAFGDMFGGVMYDPWTDTLTYVFHPDFKLPSLDDINSAYRAADSAGVASVAVKHATVAKNLTTWGGWRPDSMTTCEVFV